eukprot:6197904-Ditylum_brightwellii.AAC.1
MRTSCKNRMHFLANQFFITGHYWDHVIFHPGLNWPMPTQEGIGFNSKINMQQKTVIEETRKTDVSMKCLARANNLVQ